MLFPIRIFNNRITRKTFSKSCSGGNFSRARKFWVMEWNFLCKNCDLSALEFFNWTLLLHPWETFSFFPSWKPLSWCDWIQCVTKEKSRLGMPSGNQIQSLVSVDVSCRYQPPNLAISTLYWKAWPLLLVVAAFNPENIGECGCFSGFWFCCKNWQRCWMKSSCLCWSHMLGWQNNCC